MKTINYGYLIPLGIAFIVADITLLILNGINTFFIGLFIFQSFILYMVSVFTFTLVEYSNRGILIKTPTRFYRKWHEKDEIDYFLFRYKQDSKSGIDLYVHLKSTNTKTYFHRIKHKKILKQFVSKTKVIPYRNWFTSNGFNVRFNGDFETLNLKG